MLKHFLKQLNYGKNLKVVFIIIKIGYKKINYKNLVKWICMNIHNKKNILMKNYLLNF